MQSTYRTESELLRTSYARYTLFPCRSRQQRFLSPFFLTTYMIQAFSGTRKKDLANEIIKQQGYKSEKTNPWYKVEKFTVRTSNTRRSLFSFVVFMVRSRQEKQSPSTHEEQTSFHTEIDFGIYPMCTIFFINRNSSELLFAAMLLVQSNINASTMNREQTIADGGLTRTCLYN